MLVFILWQLAGGTIALSHETAEQLTNSGAAWDGNVKVGVGTVPLHITFSQKDGKGSGSIYVPTWGAKPWPVDEVVERGAEVTFKIPGRGEDGHFRGTVGPEGLHGTYTWRGSERVVSFSRSVDSKVLDTILKTRAPTPPFPYRAQSVEFKNGDLPIHGLLTIPEGHGPFAAVLLIGGSFAKPCEPDVPGDLDAGIWDSVLADRLARAGVAVLQTDDRGTGGTGGNKDDSTLGDLVADAVAATEYLASQKSIDPSRVGIVGASMGGLLAPIISTKSQRIHFLVLLSAPALKGEQKALAAGHALAKREGFTPNGQEDAVTPCLDMAIKLANSDLDSKEIYRRVRDAQQRQPEKIRISESALQLDVDKICKPLARSMIRFDPAPTLGSLSVPVLAINGSNDVYVIAEENQPAMVKAFEGSKNKDVTIELIEGLDHALSSRKIGPRVIDLGGPLTDDLPDPSVLDVIDNWLIAHTATRPN
jgi:hypothetical protein